MCVCVCVFVCGVCYKNVIITLVVISLKEIGSILDFALNGLLIWWHVVIV